MKFSKKQRIAMTWWTEGSPYHEKEAILCDGAVRSGKTLAMGLGFFLWAMERFNDRSFGICGKTISSFRRNVLTEVVPKLQALGIVWQEKRSENLILVRFQGRENRFYIFGGQDEGSASLIQGVTFAGVLLDEAALMPRSFVEQACARCSVEGSKLWFNCNPAGPEHWFYKEWIQGCRAKKALHLHFTMDDNPSLAPAIRARYESIYTGTFYRRYVLGQWCMAQGRIYDFDPERSIAKTLPTQGRYYISVDYGTLNPFSAGLWCVTEDKAVRLREFYHSGRDTGVMRTDEEYYQELIKLAQGLPIEQVIVDPSAASFIATIRKHGRFSVRKARNGVLPGIRLVSQVLRDGYLQIAPCCKDAIREFSLYCWEEDTGQDRPRKENDHAMDDIRYFCATVLSRRRHG